jgi:hypothetical protein
MSLKESKAEKEARPKLTGKNSRVIAELILMPRLSLPKVTKVTEITKVTALAS